MQAATTERQFLCDVASKMIWQLLNGRTIKRAAVKTKPSQVRLAAEIPFDHHAYGKVLLDLGGMRLREHAKGRVPLVYGDPNTVRSIVGSVLGLVVVERVLYGEVTFASDAKAQEVANDWNAGALSHDVSLEFSIDAGKQVGARQSYFGFPGPFQVATEWAPIAVFFPR